MVGQPNGRSGGQGFGNGQGFGQPMGAANDPLPSGQGGQAPGGQGQAPQPTPVVQVVMPAGAQPQPIISSFIPSFPALTAKIDSYAKHFPWWLWLSAGIGLSWWLWRKGGSKKILQLTGS